MTILTPGQCRVCGCTELNPCVLQNDRGEMIACKWFDLNHSLCTNLACIAKTDMNVLMRMFDLVMQESQRLIKHARFNG